MNLTFLRVQQEKKWRLRGFFRKKVQFFAKKVCRFKINVYFCTIIDKSVYHFTLILV